MCIDQLCYSMHWYHYIRLQTLIISSAKEVQQLYNIGDVIELGKIILKNWKNGAWQQHLAKYSEINRYKCGPMGSTLVWDTPVVHKRGNRNTQLIMELMALTIAEGWLNGGSLYNKHFEMKVIPNILQLLAQ